MLELLVAGSTLTALLVAGTMYRDRTDSHAPHQVIDLTTPAPYDVRSADLAAPDLPCPWCGAYTREEDAACPSCGQRFG